MESKLHGVNRASCYGAILGANPSKGARSPHLWNAVFRAFELDVVFGAYDVVESEVERVVAQLRGDPGFIGGAVGVPYKSAILPFLDELEPECERIGAANALYRRNGSLVGANTDGKGAVASLCRFLRDSNGLQNKRILMLGAGGAGKAVAAYLAGSAGPRGVLRLCNRTMSRAVELAERLRTHGGIIEAVPFDKIDQILQDTDLLINCSSVGASDTALNGAARLLNVFSTPLAPAGVEMWEGKAWDFTGCKKNISRSLEMLALLPRTAVVYDIIYRPAVTMFLKLADSVGLRCLGGHAMNLEQAVIACHSALSQSPLWKPEWSVDAIREIMVGVP